MKPPNSSFVLDVNAIYEYTAAYIQRHLVHHRLLSFTAKRSYTGLYELKAVIKNDEFQLRTQAQTDIILLEAKDTDPDRAYNLFFERLETLTGFSQPVLTNLTPAEVEN